MVILKRLFAAVPLRDWIMTLVLLAACVLLWYVELLPGAAGSAGVKCKARVLTVDNSDLLDHGLVKSGSQLLTVEIVDNIRKGSRFNAVNQLRAQLDLDKIFSPGDMVLVSIPHGADEKTAAINAQDYYRTDNFWLLFGIFALLLLIFGNITGFNALLSFVFSCLVIWKLVIPLCLKNINPLLVTFAAVVLLSVVIIVLVSGLNRRCAAALGGTLTGVAASSAAAYWFTGLFHINGAVMPYSQVLLNSGCFNLNLQQIFIGAVFLGASGAVMDLAMDIASGMQEIVEKRPDISRKELLHSGFTIGRKVVGTMTTTLLLAYSGGYLTLMMTFAAQHTEIADFINNPHVASEMVKTLVGSFGLVLVAPATALFGALLLGKKKDRR